MNGPSGVRPVCYDSQDNIYAIALDLPLWAIKAIKNHTGFPVEG
jgi:hypothetical protein